jgi:25S rRNA (uracil2634-N3)-methyltransferase
MQVVSIESGIQIIRIVGVERNQSARHIFGSARPNFFPSAHRVPTYSPLYLTNCPPPSLKMGKNKRLPKSASARSDHNPKSKSKLARPSGISKPKPKSKQQHTAPILPFSPSERILLIGEGDLSFAHSLIEFHKCTNVLATVLESEGELKEKYPHVIENIAAIEKAGGRVKYGVDARKLGKVLKGENKGWERVVFNFPHVGGKSTDVNRQVRYNQGTSFFSPFPPSHPVY